MKIPKVNKNFKFFIGLSFVAAIAIVFLFFAKTQNAQNQPSVAPSAAFFVQQGKLTAADAADNDRLSDAVAVSGDYAVVGAPSESTVGSNYQGAAYVYVRNGSTWTQQQKITLADGTPSDKFGYSVAIGGDTIAIGRYNTGAGENRSDGRVYIYKRSGTTWNLAQTLSSSDIASGDSFGNAVALENDTLVIGARNKNNGANLFQGAAYVFTRTDGGNFSQEAKLLASDGQQTDFFGESVAVSGNTAIIGSVNDFGQANAKGQAYVFVRNGSSWTQQQILRAQNSNGIDGFGARVSVSGDYALISANIEQTVVQNDGAAYIFFRNGTTWTQQQKLTLPNPQVNDGFGNSVAVKGDILAVGAPGQEFLSGISNHGAVYTYERNGTTWTRVQEILHNDPSADALGFTLAFDGSSIIAGAPSKSTNRGAAYIFAVDTQPQPQKIIAAGMTGNSGFGVQVAVDGNTAIITDFNLTPSNAFGKIYAYVKNSGTWQQQDVFWANDRNFNWSHVALNGNTAVLSSPIMDINGNFQQGAVYVFTRNGTTWTQQAKLLASDGAANDRFGSSIDIIGDTIAVGAAGDTVGANAAQGSVYIFTRNGTNWTQQTKLNASDGRASANFGNSLAFSGNSLLVGAVNHFNLGISGSAYVFVNNNSVWTEQTKLTPTDTSTGGGFGWSVDLDGDTAIVGAMNLNNGSTSFVGAAFVYRRNGTNWTQQSKILPPDGIANDRFGSQVRLRGNIAAVVNGTTTASREAVQTFKFNGTSWEFTRRIGSPNLSRTMSFYIDFDGKNLFVGAPNDVDSANVVTGAVYAYPFQTVRAVSDFDGDGKADIAVFRPSNGTWYWTNSSNNQFSGVQFGISTDIIAPGDFDGDGKTDSAVFRNGVWYLLRSSAGFTTIQFGSTEDIPQPEDFDGDGKADIAVFRPSNGTWYRLNSSNGGFHAQQFGQSGDKPAAKDFDGDGKADIAVFRPSNGVWYRLNSSNNQFSGVQFGIAEDLIVPADYDGDGKADIAVFRPSNGVWYRLNSSNGAFDARQFGVSNDKPVPADYDGDGKTDIAVFRGGVWYISQNSGSLLSVINFGAAEDKPISNAFVK